MKNVIRKTKYFSLLLILGMLTGCQNKEEKIKELMLADLEQRYSEEFEIVDFNYNKTYKCYEAGVQTDKLKNGCAAEVNYYVKDGIFDGYYASLYCVGVAQDFEDELDLFGEKYIYSTFLINMMGPQNKKNSYEEYKEYMNVENAIITVNVYYASGAEETETIESATAIALEALEHPNCDVNVYLVSENELPGIREYVTNHYRRYDNDDMLKDYECSFQVRKREGVISLPEK